MDTTMDSAQSGAPVLDLQDESRHTAVGVVWRIYAAFIYPFATRRVLLTDGWVSWDDANDVYCAAAERFMRHGDTYGPFRLRKEVNTVTEEDRKVKYSVGTVIGTVVDTAANWRDSNAVDRSQLSAPRDE